MVNNVEIKCAKIKISCSYSHCCCCYALRAYDEEIDNKPEVNIPLENDVCVEGQDIHNAICDYLVEQGLICKKC